MIQVKFRCWDTENNCFVDCSNHTISQINNNYAGLGNRYLYSQFSGMYDKNMREMYVGDIIECVGEGLRSDYRKGVMQFELENACESGFHFGSVGWYTEEIEVIGNIYEHPELAEAKPS